MKVNSVLYWDNGCWVAEAKTTFEINKRLVPLTSDI